MLSGCTYKVDQGTNNPLPDTILRSAERPSKHGGGSREKVDNEYPEALSSENETDVYSELALRFIKNELYPDRAWEQLEMEERKYAFSPFDLNNDQRNEILIAVTAGWCGSGGCRFWIIDDQRNLVSSTSVIKFPIGISSKVSYGWFDLLVFSNGHHRILKFDGSSYSPNGSLADTISKAEREALTLAEVLSDPWEEYLTF